MVRADQAERAQELLAVLGDPVADFPEPVNAEYLADARGHRPRGYGLLGAYTRIYLWAFGAILLAFGVFLLLRAL